MTGILDRFTSSPTSPIRTQFRPASTHDCFALRLAYKLGDAAAAEHYADLGRQYSQDYLLSIFHRTVRSSAENRARVFHELLPLTPTKLVPRDYRARLAAIRVERRSIAVIIMTGDVIEYEQVRQLSSASDKAVASALSFVMRMIEQFPCTSAVLEPVPGKVHIQRGVLTSQVIALLRQHGMAVWEVSKRDLFAAFGYPPLRSRKEPRALVSQLFPFLNGGYGSAFARDAAALGLFVQIERLFLP